MIVIGAKDYNAVMGPQNTNNRKSVIVTISNGQFTCVADVEELTLEVSSGKWQFLTSDNKYLCASGTSNKSDNKLTSTADNTLASTKATITISSNNAKIQFDGQAKSKIVRCNPNSPKDPLFSCYAGTQDDIQIYKKQDSGKIATTTTFGDGYDNKKFTFTDGVLEGFKAPTATWTPAGVGGSVAYSSSDKDIVTVDNGGKLKFTNTKFGTATITATFTPTETTKYKVSSASYTVENKEGERIATTIAFAEGIENSIVTVKDGETFDGYKATCTTEGAKGAIQYSSSNTDVATVDDATGAVTMGSKYGKTVITAQFIGAGGYANSDKISYTIEYKGVYAFYESFDKCTSVGGNSGGWSGLTKGSTLSDKLTDVAGWSFVSGKESDKCARFGTGAKKGSATTPQIALERNAELTFKAGSWKEDNRKLVISVTAGTLTYNGKTAKTQTISLADAAWETYSMIISGTSNFKITFAAATDKNNRFFLDEVMVKEIAADVTLDEDKDNVVEAAENANVTVKRTFYKDGDWNTLCLPFDVSAKEVKDVFGSDAQLRQVDEANSKDNTVAFTTATAIKAGVPYLIKFDKLAENADQPEEFNHTFEGVTLTKKVEYSVLADFNIIFTGSYSAFTPEDFLKEYNTCDVVASMAAANTLKKVYAGTTIKGLRAVFGLSSSVQPQAVKVVIDGTTTGIGDLHVDGASVANGRVYNLNGQCVGTSLEGLKAGVYIQNGKKVIINK